MQNDHFETKIYNDTIYEKQICVLRGKLVI